MRYSRKYKDPSKDTWLAGKKTYIFNLTVMLVGALTYLYDQGEVTPDQLKLTALFIAIGNLVIRHLTDAPITVHKLWRRKK